VLDLFLGVVNIKGWIKLYRELLKKAIWSQSTPEQKTILITLLMMANHDVKEWEWKGKKYICEPGEFITSLESIRENAGKGISIQNIRTALVRFEKYDFLTSEVTNKNRRITIKNWALYQSKDEQLTSKLTSNQQATNKQLTTNKNVKNVKNNKNNKQVVEEGANVFNFFQENIGLITPFQAEYIQSYLDDGVEEKFVKEIIVDSIGKDNPWSWIRKVLESSAKKNIKTLEQYKATKVEHKRKAETKYKSNNAPPQTKNHEQRKYSDDYLNSLYEN
jgi:DnaD/phage-associated family protein